MHSFERKCTDRITNCTEVELVRNFLTKVFFIGKCQFIKTETFHGKYQIQQNYLQEEMDGVSSQRAPTVYWLGHTAVIRESGVSLCSA